MADYVVQQEDGTSKIELEDGSGFVLLEQQPTGTPRRISQEPVEVVVAPTSAKARASQVPVEVIVQQLYETTQIIFIDPQPVA